MNTRKYKKTLGILLISLVTVLTSCTKLYDTSYGEFLADQFEPTEEDIPAIIGNAYGSWRELLLFWNGYWRANEVGADEIVIPARPNGWVDGGIYRRIHEHTWTVDEVV